MHCKVETFTDTPSFNDRQLITSAEVVLLLSSIRISCSVEIGSVITSLTVCIVIVTNAVHSSNFFTVLR